MLNPIDYSISKFTAFADDETLALIRSIAKTKFYKRGDIIETRGEDGDHMHFIDEGLVQIGISGMDGSRFNLTRLGAGHTFGETAYFIKQEVIYDAHAESDVKLQKLSAKDIDYLLSHSLTFTKALMSVCSMRVQTTLSYIGDTLGMPVQARLAKQILSVSESVNHADIIIVRQVDLAHALGLSRVSIGKALKEMSRAGLIQIGYGKLEILSREKLTQLIRKSQRKN